jgi:hypothetical protein
MSTHTPGPWRADNNGRIYTQEGLYVAAVGDAPNRSGAKRDEYARLIAAAPELLEALEAAAETIKALDEDYDMHPVYIAARAAIAKARGESK